MAARPDSKAATIETAADIAAALAALRRLDPRLEPVIDLAGPVPLRRQAPGFASLAEIIVSQQVSKASADAIYRRLLGLIDPLEPEAVLAAGEDALRAAGLSRPKQKTMLAVAQAVAGGLDLHHLCGLEAEDAMARMVALHGIGPWTAEIYLLFAEGRPDIWPAGDLGVQAGLHRIFALPERPDEKQARAMAEAWRPHRGAVAIFTWHCYDNPAL